jgi:hypothetical protein
LTFRDPDYIAVEFVVIRPNSEVQSILDEAGVS